MLAAILAAIGPVVVFLCKLATEWLDGNKERRKEKKEVKSEIKKATTQRDRIMLINRYNNL